MTNQFEPKSGSPTPESSPVEGLSVSEKLELEAHLDAIMMLQKTKASSIANLLTISDLLNKVRGLLDKVLDRNMSVSIKNVRLALKKDLKKTKDR